MRAPLLLALLALGCVRIPSGKVSDGVFSALDCMDSPGCNQQPETVGARVWGRVVIDGALGEQPVSFTRVNLMRRGTMVATASSDRSGAFLFRGAINDGSYALVLESDRYEGEVPVLVDGSAREVVLVATPRPSKP